MLKKKLFLLIVLLVIILPVLVHAQANKPVIYLGSVDNNLPKGALLVIDALALKEISRIPLDGDIPDEIVLRSDEKVAFITNGLGLTGMSILDLV